MASAKAETANPQIQSEPKKAGAGKAPSKEGTPKKAGSKKALSAKSTKAPAKGEASAFTTGGKGTRKDPLTTVLDLTQIVVVKGFNPRSNLDGLEALKRSIKAKGLFMPLLVRPNPDKAGTYLLVDGERRYVCCKDLGLTRVPCNVRTDFVDDVDAKTVAVMSNDPETHAQLNPVDEGRWFQECRDTLKQTPEQIAKEHSASLPHVRRCLKIVDQGGSDIQSAVLAGRMTLSAAEHIARMDSDTRKAMKDTLAGRLSAVEKSGEHIGLTEAKRMAKDAEKAAGGPKKASTTKKGTRPKRTTAIKSWRGVRELDRVGRWLCAHLKSMKMGKAGEPEVAWVELRAQAALFFWYRGDLDSYAPPEYEEGLKGYSKKALDAFNALVDAEAALYNPERDDTGL